MSTTELESLSGSVMSTLKLQILVFDILPRGRCRPESNGRSVVNNETDKKIKKNDVRKTDQALSPDRQLDPHLLRGINGERERERGA